MAGSSRRNILIAVVVVMLAAVIGLGLKIYQASDRWDQIYRIRLVASAYNDGGQPTNEPTPFSWRLGEGTPTSEAIYHEFEFRANEPGWRAFPHGASTFQEVVNILFPGSKVARTYWSMPDEAGQEALLAQLPDRKPGAVDADAWPLAITSDTGEIDTMILLVALREDGERVVLPIRSGELDRWVVSCSFSVEIVQDPAAQRWAFRQGGPSVVTEEPTVLHRLRHPRDRSTRYWNGTLRVNVGPKIER